MSCVGICFDSLSMTRRSNSLFVQVFKCRCVWHLREFLNKIHKLHINNSSDMVFLWSTLQQSKASFYLNLKRFAIKLPVHGARHSKRWGGAATVTRPTGRQSKKEYFIDPRLTNAALSLSVDRNSSARRCGGQNVHVLSCLWREATWALVSVCLMVRLCRV